MRVIISDAVRKKLVRYHVLDPKLHGDPLGPQGFKAEEYDRAVETARFMGWIPKPGDTSVNAMANVYAPPGTRPPLYVHLEMAEALFGKRAVETHKAMLRPAGAYLVSVPAMRAVYSKRASTVPRPKHAGRPFTPPTTVWPWRTLDGTDLMPVIPTAADLMPIAEAEGKISHREITSRLPQFVPGFVVPAHVDKIVKALSDGGYPDFNAGWAWHRWVAETVAGPEGERTFIFEDPSAAAPPAPTGPVLKPRPPGVPQSAKRARTRNGHARELTDPAWTTLWMDGSDHWDENGEYVPKGFSDPDRVTYSTETVADAKAAGKW